MSRTACVASGTIGCGASFAQTDEVSNTLKIGYAGIAFGDSTPVAAGVNTTWFTDNHVSSNYTAALGGTSSATLKRSFGPVAKLGFAIPLAENWELDRAYARYWIKNTATIATDTPGVGVIKRKIDVKADPDVFGLTVGYRF